MSFKLTHSTLGRRVAMLFGTAAIATMGLAGSMAGTAGAEVPPYAYQTHPYQLCRFAAQYYDTPVDKMTQEDAETAVECLVNEERARNGLPELWDNAELTSAARGLANEGAETGRWGERDPEAIESRIGASGYCPNGTREGRENTLSLAEPGPGAPAPTPHMAVSWWMSGAFGEDSAKTNILDPNMTETGVGVVVVPDPEGKNGPRAWIVQDFGRC